LHLLRLAKRIRAVDPDVINQHYTTFFGLASFLLPTIPWVISVWGSDIYQFARLSKRNITVIRFLLKRADAITTSSNAMREDLTNTFGVDKEKITTFSWGVDLSVFSGDHTLEARKIRRELGIPQDSPVVLSIRHFRERYGVADIVGSIPLVLRNHPETVFVFVGGQIDKEFEKEQRRTIAKLGVEANVRIIPRLIEPVKMATLLETSSIFISIPHWDQLSTSVLEGMACGSIPVVGELDVYREIIRDGVNGFIVPLNDSIALAQRLSFVLENWESYRKRFGEFNRKYISENHDWKAQASIILEVYRKAKLSRGGDQLS